MTTSHWLMEYVVMKAENAAVWSLTTGVIGIVVISPFRTIIKSIWRVVRSLDPETDYGVTKQLDELKDQVDENNGDTPLKGLRHAHRVR